jgi:hypothetical protein
MSLRDRAGILTLRQKATLLKTQYSCSNRGTRDALARPTTQAGPPDSTAYMDHSAEARPLTRQVTAQPPVAISGE